MIRTDEPDPAGGRDDGRQDQAGLEEAGLEEAGLKEAAVGDAGTGEGPVEDVGTGEADVPPEEVSAEEVGADGEPSEEGQDEPVQEELIVREVDPGAIEAILLVVDEPITAVTLATVLDRTEHAVAEALRGLAMAYDAEQRGFDLREVAGGWRLYTRERYADIVEKFVLDGQQAKLTQASLETLAVVAYRQPVNRSRVSAIRGVNCDGVMRTLVSRGLVEEAGSDNETGATLYRTTSYFLERLGLNALDELPDLAPYLPEMDEIEDAAEPERTAARAPKGGTSSEADKSEADTSEAGMSEAGMSEAGTSEAGTSSTSRGLAAVPPGMTEVEDNRE